MKAIIWIIVVIAVIWGIWWWVGMSNNTNTTAGTYDNTSGSVTASSTNTLDPLTPDSKG